MFEISYRSNLSTCLRNVLFMLMGVLALLFGMYCTYVSFGDNVSSSYIDILWLLIAIIFTTRAIRLDNIIGRKNTKIFIICVLFLTLFSIIFSTNFVFDEYLAKRSSDIAYHDEHSWTYGKMTAIADILHRGSFDEFEDLYLNQYASLYTYSSLVFYFGGNVVTHICIWNAFHLSIMCITFALICVNARCCSKEILFPLMLLCLFQPAFDTLHVYTRDIVGESGIMIGLYLFLSSCKKSMQCFMLFPIYGYLFYAQRYQYIAIAFFLFAYSVLFIQKRSATNIMLLIVILVVSIGLFVFGGVSDKLYTELHVADYVEEHSRGVVTSIILGFVGGFPWTILLTDKNWTYHSFLYLQSMMMLSILFWLYKKYKDKYKDVLKDPILVCGLVFYSFGFIDPGHVKYFVVGFPMLITGLVGIRFKYILSTFYRLVILIIFASLIYDMIGLTGSGLLNN